MSYRIIGSPLSAMLLAAMKTTMKNNEKGTELKCISWMGMYSNLLINNIMLNSYQVYYISVVKCSVYL